jgi:hypothetical protein
LSQTAGRDPLEQSFQALESNQRLERDLEQLKARRPPELR